MVLRGMSKMRSADEKTIKGQPPIRRRGLLRVDAALAKILEAALVLGFPKFYGEIYILVVKTRPTYIHLIAK